MPEEDTGAERTGGCWGQRLLAQHTYQRLELCYSTLKGVGLSSGVHGHGQQRIVLEPAHVCAMMWVLQRCCASKASKLHLPDGAAESMSMMLFVGEIL
jgi:hypothetical protein